MACPVPSRGGLCQSALRGAGMLSIEMVLLWTRPGRLRRQGATLRRAASGGLSRLNCLTQRTAVGLARDYPRTMPFCTPVPCALERKNAFIESITGLSQSSNCGRRRFRSATQRQATQRVRQRDKTVQQQQQQQQRRDGRAKQHSHAAARNKNKHVPRGKVRAASRPLGRNTLSSAAYASESSISP